MGFNTKLAGEGEGAGLRDWVATSVTTHLGEKCIWFWFKVFKSFSHEIIISCKLKNLRICLAEVLVNTG